MDAGVVTYSGNCPSLHMSVATRVEEPRLPYTSKHEGSRVTESPTFEHLVALIQQTHEALLERATKAVNITLTLRNWLIGHHIQEYEQAGEDRAAYGEQLLELLAARLRKLGLQRVEARELRRYRQFYAAYPQIREALSPELPGVSRDILARIHTDPDIRETVSPESGVNLPDAIPRSLPRLLIEQLSFSHFLELMQIEDPLRRVFYEVEALRGNWSVRELRRQVATQYFERCGLSADKDALSRLAHEQAEAHGAQHVVRDPYVFEFLGLRPSEVMSEGHLEDALIDKLQEFLLELGHGFCFEARQKRLILGGEHFFVDLVFYHRVLKCHVLVELKNDRFRHEHLGQLNSYVAWYKQHQMTPGDQPPIGILLCTHKNHELVEFALADMSNKLFVSRYQVQLPDKKEIAEFLQKAVGELEGVGGSR